MIIFLLAFTFSYSSKKRYCNRAVSRFAETEIEDKSCLWSMDGGSSYINSKKKNFNIQICYLP